MLTFLPLAEACPAETNNTPLLRRVNPNSFFGALGSVCRASSVAFLRAEVYTLN